ncbi:MAG TPA: serine hydrolase domain-containing protein [Thermoanaerobaculia bacterium]|jgi:CubicO group peptidase (beta-lactamase class C family)
MIRAFIALLLILGHFPVAATTRRRAVQHPLPYVVPAAVVTAAREAAQPATAAGVPAVQIAVSRYGQIIYTEAFGVTDTTSMTAATPRSVMMVGSVTKQFTAAGILRLAERGALTLDDRIDSYVPEFDSRGATITLRQLLSHTSGLPRDWYPQTSSGLAPPEAVTREQTITSLNAQAFNSPPGTKWFYSNAGYMLLGYAIETITGKSFGNFIHSEFALPLGLIDTGVCGTNNLPLPQGYSLLTKGAPKPMTPPHTSVLLSAGMLCSTASDLARWSYLLASGQVMLPASYATMITPARLDNNDLVQSGYALGVATEKMLGQASVWHSGAIDGFQSFLVFFPDQAVAVAVMTSAFPAPPGLSPLAIATAVAKAALGIP